MRREDSDKIRGTHIFESVWKAYLTLSAHGDQSKNHLGLCDSDFRVLQALLHKGPLPVNVIGDLVGLTTGSITTAIHRLEQKRLAVRNFDPSDRRLRIVELTPKGRRFIEKAFERYRTQMEAGVQMLTPGEKLTLVNLLQKVCERAQGAAIDLSSASG